VVSGLVPDAAGNETLCGGLGGVDASATYSVTVFQRHWFSSDGVRWAGYDPWVGNSVGGALIDVYKGEMGDVLPMFGLRSADGLTWSQDAADPSSQTSGATQFSSDGDRVIAQSDGPVFTVSFGDGNWHRLANVGSIGSLPRGGQSWVVPNGVIYDAGGRIYFGRALTGVIATGTLRPGPSTTFGP
jgi:hypothetical protein